VVARSPPEEGIGPVDVPVAGRAAVERQAAGQGVRSGGVVALRAALERLLRFVDE